MMHYFSQNMDVKEQEQRNHNGFTIAATSQPNVYYCRYYGHYRNSDRKVLSNGKKTGENTCSANNINSDFNFGWGEHVFFFDLNLANNAYSFHDPNNGGHGECNITLRFEDSKTLDFTDIIIYLLNDGKQKVKIIRSTDSEQLNRYLIVESDNNFELTIQKRNEGCHLYATIPWYTLSMEPKWYNAPWSMVSMTPECERIVYFSFSVTCEKETQSDIINWNWSNDEDHKSNKKGACLLLVT